MDLDAEVSGRQTSRIAIKTTSQLGHVAVFLKKRYTVGHQRISPNTRIEFYSGRERLDRDEIPKGIATLSYRTYHEGDDGTLRVDWGGSNVSLSIAQQDRVELEIHKDGTVGTIRETIIQLLQESDPVKLNKEPFQIEICAVGGLRPGALQGSNWIVSRIDSWLCRYIRIYFRLYRDYLNFTGFNEGYVWHQPNSDRNGCVQVRSLKQWLRREVLSVGPNGENGMKIRDEDIRILKEGTALRDRTRVRVGTSLEFEVTRTVEDRFVQAEAWLLPVTEMCSVCTDDKRVSEMPRKVTASCVHPATACKECVGQWISSSLETMAWDRLKCPECPQLLRFEDVRAFVSRAIFERYDLSIESI